LDGRSGPDQNSYPENSRRLLRQRHSSTEGACENDTENHRRF